MSDAHEEGRAIDAEDHPATEALEAPAQPERAEQAQTEAPTPAPSATGEAPAPSPAVASEAPCRPKSYLPGWPFLLYVLVWVALAVATLLELGRPEAPPLPLDDPAYPALLVAGLALVATGPVLSLVVWAFARAKASVDCRHGLLTTALVRGAAATLGGVVMWWGALMLVDALRLGLVR